MAHLWTNESWSLLTSAVKGACGTPDQYGDCSGASSGSFVHVEQAPQV
jgi:hypothetical protein